MNANKKGIAICVAALFLLCAILLGKNIWRGVGGDSTEVVNDAVREHEVTGSAITEVVSGVAVSAEETQTGQEAEKNLARKGKEDEKENQKGGEKSEAETGDKKNSSDPEDASDVKNASKGSSETKDEKQKAAGKKSSGKKSSGKKSGGKTGGSTAKKGGNTSAGVESGNEGTQTENSPEPTNAPQEQKNECSLTVTCSEVLSHMDKLSESASRVIPSGGMILQGNYEFTQGDTAFDVLKRACAEKKIHLDYAFTPLYATYYIRGINNLYEFDCGDESGWMYLVNGKDPGCGCSQYKLSKGDQVRFEYTCEY